MNIILSINPTWGEKILNGEKVIEFRKTIPKTLIRSKAIDFYRAKIFLYESGDVKKVVGYCNFKSIVFHKVFFNCFGQMIEFENTAFKQEKSYSERVLYAGGDIEEKLLYKYSLPKRFVYCWEITNPVRFDNPINISEFLKDKPPQSFCYTPWDIIDKTQER